MISSFETLGLAADATLLEIERAHQRLRALYAEDSLATYSLLTIEQRHERLAAIDEAFRLTVAARTENKIAAPPIAAVDTCNAPPPAGAAPDPQLAPGAYLRWTRLRSGQGLKDLAERTKLSSSRLEHIEQDRYDKLPPAVYLRGFITEYARCLGIAEPRQLAESYMRRLPPSPSDD